MLIRSRRTHPDQRFLTLGLLLSFTLALLLTLPLLSASAFAQDDEAQITSNRWFQVEVILFANRNIQNEEMWRNDVALSYPSNWVQLKNPDSPASQAPETEEAAQDAPVNLATAAFYRLPDNARSLNKQAKELGWSKAYDLLYHEAWRQPVESQGKAPSVLISAGETYGDHRRLEGSLSVSVSRYLHVSTNIWLTDFIRNDGQEHEYWPMLPDQPVRPVERNIMQTLQEEEASSAATSNSDTTNNAQATGGSETSLYRAYLPQSIALLKQTRRMRSGEVHYIDNPKVGMLILVTPYDPAKQASVVPQITDNKVAVTSEGSESFQSYRLFNAAH